MTMAEELKSAEKYREALELLQPVMEHYRREQWRPLLDAVLSLGLKCAYLLADAAQGIGNLPDGSSQIFGNAVSAELIDTYKVTIDGLPV